MDKDTNYRDRILTIDNVPYRLLRVIDKTSTNLHHIISRKENKKFNVHHERNKMVINMRVHDALNRLFWDRQNPKKQLEFMLNIWKEVLSTWVRQELYTILNLPDDMFYHKDLIKDGKKKKREDTWWEWDSNRC